jgi:hypothetical protein
MKLEPLVPVDIGNGLVIFGTKRALDGLRVLGALVRDAGDLAQAIQEIQNVLADTKSARPTRADAALRRIREIVSAIETPRIHAVMAGLRRPSRRKR